MRPRYECNKNFFTRITGTHERLNDEVIEGGRRAGENQNPYLNARRTWNDHMGSVSASRNMWQIMAILSFMIVLAAVGGVIYIGSQSKFIPYVVQVEHLAKRSRYHGRTLRHRLIRV